jgi:hypothetical protein
MAVLGGVRTRRDGDCPPRTRFVILSEGTRRKLLDVGAVAETNGTLESLERRYIVRVLRKTNGVIAGPVALRHGSG